MSKKQNNPVEQMKLNIEFADNGIILRNPDIEDEVTLALTLEEKTDSEGVKTDWHMEEYRAIGKNIYDWLVDVAIVDHFDHWVCTGANLHIVAELEGRTR